MLTELEFMDKKHIVLDKFDYTYIMNKGTDNLWAIICVPKDTVTDIQVEDEVPEEDAYRFYRERMESFGFMSFPIIVE